MSQWPIRFLFEGTNPDAARTKILDAGELWVVREALYEKFEDPESKKSLERFVGTEDYLIAGKKGSAPGGRNFVVLHVMTHVGSDRLFVRFEFKMVHEPTLSKKRQDDKTFKTEAQALAERAEQWLSHLFPYGSITVPGNLRYKGEAGVSVAPSVSMSEMASATA